MKILIVKQYSLTDTKFSIDVELLKVKINSLITHNEERYNTLKRELENWVMPCAKETANKINNTIKNKGQAVLE